jgi:hypothetical protein
MSDDTSGIEYITFFDKETRKFVRAVSGLGRTNADDDEEDENLTEEELE